MQFIKIISVFCLLAVSSLTSQSFLSIRTDPIVTYPASQHNNTWIYQDNNWYYADSKGLFLKETWIADGKYWYYLDSSGVMVKAPYLIDGHLEGFDSQGHWIGNTYQYHGVPIIIKGKYDPSILHKYIRQLETLPNDLTSLPTQYIFSDEFERGPSPHTVGYIESTFKNTFSFKTTTIDSITITSLEFHESTILHELTHALDIMTRYGLSNNSEFIEAIQLDQKQIETISYSHEPEEYLAYLSVDYFRNPDLAHQTYPNCAAYIRKIFEDYSIPNDYYINTLL